MSCFCLDMVSKAGDGIRGNVKGQNGLAQNECSYNCTNIPVIN